LARDGHSRHEISVNIDRHGRYRFQDGRHRLAIARTLGIACVPVRVLVRDRKWVEFRGADRIRIAERRHFMVIFEDLFFAVMKPPLVDRRFRVVLAFNIFHHSLKRQELFEKFKKWLPRLDVDTMFFEPHCPKERQMVGAHVNFGPEEFVGFILKHSCLREAQLIARCADSRLLYRLTR
jgi:hypothetical protein